MSVCTHTLSYTHTLSRAYEVQMRSAVFGGRVLGSMETSGSRVLLSPLAH
jgi:hypothetical protein